MESGGGKAIREASPGREQGAARACPPPFHGAAACGYSPLWSPARPERQADIYAAQGPQPQPEAIDVAHAARTATDHRRFAVRRADVSSQRLEPAVHGRWVRKQV